MGGPRLASMAWRNLWRNRRRTLVTLSSIVFGVFLAVIFTGMGDATYAEMIDLAARLGGGHLSIQHAEYLDRPAVKRTIVGARGKRNLALADPETARAVIRVAGHAMLAAGGESQGAALLAYDPKEEDESTLSILEAVKQGRRFAQADERGIVLGRKLAENLGITLGRKVVFTLTDKRGEIVSGLARVSGIISSGAPSVDATLCLLPIDRAREALGYAADEATLVAVFLKDQRHSDRVAGRLAPRLAGAAAVPWHQSQPELAGFIRVKVNATLFFELIIAILVAAGIFNTLFVSVMERLREFGIMMAIGYSPGQVFRLVMWESLWIALVGLAVAAAVTAWPYHHFSTQGIDMSMMVGKGGTEVAGVAMDPMLRVGIYPENALFIAGAVVAATLLSGLYPAWRAGRVAPSIRSSSCEVLAVTQSPQTRETPIVELREVVKHYRQGTVEVPALRGLSLTVHRGEFVALSGPSGSGKTTVLNLIGALDSPTSGTVLLEGQDLGRLSRSELSAIRRDRIGFVFQAYNLIPVLTAYENAESVLALQGVSAKQRRGRVMDLLAQVGLQGMEQRRPDHLSGGQQQRVAIARAIAADPAVVLADEPTANVDSETAEKLLAIMEHLNQAHGATFIFSTHDARVMAHARRVVRLVDGRVESDERKG